MQGKGESILQVQAEHLESTSAFEKILEDLQTHRDQRLGLTRAKIEANEAKVKSVTSSSYDDETQPCI